VHDSTGTMRIGTIAAAARISVDAVRYYERLRLLTPDGRTEGGFRTYSRDTLERLAFIRQAQRLGLRLREIRDLLQARGAGKQQCQRVRTLLMQRLEVIDVQMNELEAFRRTLRTAVRSCDVALRTGNVSVCPVVESLAAPATTRSTSRSR
jgi:DNA-binding transcriptional MerR regulator